MEEIKKEPLPAKGTVRIDNKDRRDPSHLNIKSRLMVSNKLKKKSPNIRQAVEASNYSQENIEKHTSINLTPAPPKSKSTVQRDAQAMVYIFKRMKSGMENFEHIYESLRRLHGPDFEKHFRDGLVSKGGSRD